MKKKEQEGERDAFPTNFHYFLEKTNKRERVCTRKQLQRSIKSTVCDVYTYLPTLAVSCFILPHIFAICACKIKRHILGWLSKRVNKARHISLVAIFTLLVWVPLGSWITCKLSKEPLLLLAGGLTSTTVHHIHHNILVMVLHSPATGTSILHTTFFVALRVEQIATMPAEEHLCLGFCIFTHHF